MLGMVLALSFVAIGATDTTSYVVLNHGRPAGELLVVTVGDTLVVRYHHVDRNRGPRSESRYVISKGRVIGGQTWTLPLYGLEPTRGAPLDRFEVVRDSVFWRTGDSTRRAPLTPSSYYRLRSLTAYDHALLARFLLSRPDRSAQILPSGSARLEIVADTVVRTKVGRQRVRLAMLQGPRGIPNGVWLDDKGELFAGEATWFIPVRRGSEDALPVLRAIEIRYRNRQAEDLARKVAPAPASAVAIVNGDVFDSDRGVVLKCQTVLVRGDRIVAIGPGDSVSLPAGAMRVDATGKTVMPGMWDMHTHAFLTSQSTRAVADLATGITSVRDLASDIDVATSLRDRAAAGTLASPRWVLAGFIEGPGKWAGPTDVIVRTEEEARAWVARYDSLDYKQIKLYNLVQQDLVPAIADETHKRGMRLSGHVPRGLSTPAAVRLGFDEINHSAFLFSTFFPDSLYLPQMRAYSTVAQIVAPNIDIDGPDMTALIELLKQQSTVIDGTFNLWMRFAGAPSGLPTPTDSVAQKSDANVLRLIKRLYDAGVTLVPGTDGSSYNAELELYERAGIPAAQVLRIATIIPAKVMKDDRNYGSIAVGKVADLIIVDGKPAERVGDLRKVERVIRAGRVYESKTLRTAIGAEQQ